MTKNKNNIDKILTLAGILLLILPIIFLIVSSIENTITRGELTIDYLLMVKLFPMAFIGTFLLYIVAKRTGLYRSSTRALTLIIVLSLLISNMIAVFTGLAEGRIAAGGVEYFTTLLFIAVYILAVVAQIILGVLLFFKLFQKPKTVKEKKNINKNTNNSNSSSNNINKRKNKKKKRK